MNILSRASCYHEGQNLQEPQNLTKEAAWRVRLGALARMCQRISEILLFPRVVDWERWACRLGQCICTLKSDEQIGEVGGSLGGVLLDGGCPTLLTVKNIRMELRRGIIYSPDD